ncbi:MULTISPECIES: hypothetical protein [Calothrix]|uniref:Uncharacterized protein n=2 Tax=Calothrix TaxID=1186 RepID=A0ABR8ALD8_9CYAN|nr:MULTISPECIES: hypothetical protein [Calothrix]MBD2199451.1 hypothetical protein [Calothrix parietina FACHB-288]MBD2228261.1 hypothetical protein [Calothrix anomala FACHB-343]
MENSRNQQEKKDWSKKGLGWLPDYPDLRDYNLGNEEGIKNNLIKIEERTNNFEQSVNNLIDVISKIADKIGDDLSIKNTVEELRTQIFGNVRFAKVKVYKILRYISENTDRTDDLPPANPIPYESVLSKQILDLKQYLFLIESSMCAKKGQDFNWDISESLDWMRNSEYDERTKSLVQKLQVCSKIQDDGIVGIETYNALNEYFYKENDSKNKKILESQNDRGNQSIISAKSSSEVNFVAISSLITIKEFKIILKILKNKVIEQIDNEFHNEFPKDKNNDFDSLTPQNKKERVNTFVEKFFEYSFLEAIEISIKLEFQNLFKLTQDDFNQITQNNELKNLIIKIVEEINNIVKEINNTSSPSSKILEALQNSSVTRPIFSVITRTFSPLSQYSNQTWEEMITKGFNNLDKPADLNPEPGYSQEKLISTAISQVTSLLQKEIEKNKANTSALFICFLLKKYLNRLKEKHMKDVKIDIKKMSIKVIFLIIKKYLKLSNFLAMIIILNSQKRLKQTSRKIYLHL